MCSLRPTVVLGAQVQPNHLLVRHDSLSIVDSLDDAFTMSFKAVLRHACRHSHRHCHQHMGGSHSLGRRGSAGDADEFLEAKRLAMAAG